MNCEETTTLFRPVGRAELDKIEALGWRAFPPRLSWQPIFYPVLTEEYAIAIARDWNTNDAASGFEGFVTRFRVRSEFLSQFEPKRVGGPGILEYWIPSERLSELNANIVGQVEVIHRFQGNPGTSLNRAT